MESRKKKTENTKKKRVLFICTHNSARSQMAEGALRALYPEHYEAYSAGVEPSEVNPHSVKVMDEIGIDISHHRSKSIKEFIEEMFDCVITVCDQAKESCPFFPGRRVVHKNFPDPSLLKGTEEEVLEGFRKIRDEIMNWITSVFKSEELRQG